MITVAECNQIITHLLPIFQNEQVLLSNCVGRILAQAVIADTDQPPFNKSAMDGYACNSADIELPLKNIGVIAAGIIVNKPLQTGECYRIFTGAPIPPGANCVLMQEETLIDGNGLINFTAKQAKSNICYKGEDSKVGNVVIEAGTIIKPQHLAIMASYGVLNPVVYRKINVSLYCSGSELIEPTDKPNGAMIRNSNASQLIGQLNITGANVQYKGIIADNFDTVSNNIKLCIGNTNVIIITGGASVGDFDFIPHVLKNMGAQILFSALNIQPGKPVIFANYNNTYIFGLSGNPVSSFIQYKLVVEPVLLKLMGANTFLPKILQMPLSANIYRKKGNRQLYTPVLINNKGEAEPLPFNGSAHIGALNLACGFAMLEPEVNEIKLGENASVLLI